MVSPFIGIFVEMMLYERDMILPVTLLSAIVIVPFIIASFNRERNAYYIYNVHIQMILPTIKNILNEKDIPYEEREKAILLKDYDSSIYYKKALDTLRLDFKDIKDLSFQEEIMKELKGRVTETQSKVFPFSGVIYIGLGVLLFLVAQYF